MMSERLYVTGEFVPGMKPSDPEWRDGEGAHGRVTVETVKDVRVGIGTPGEAVISKGSKLMGDFSEKGSVIVVFDPPDSIPEKVALVHLWRDEYEIVVGDGEMLVANDKALKKTTTNGDPFQSGPECFWIAIALGDGRALARLDPTEDGEGGFFKLDSFVLEKGEWSLVVGTPPGVEVFVRGLHGVQE